MDRGKTFSPAMVRAILTGRKLQTRRLATKSARASAGQAGDRIYVREHWKTIAKHNGLSPRAIGRLYEKAASRCSILYLADGAYQDWCATAEEMEEVQAWRPGRHRQGMHMPRWASRLTLDVSEVRIEKLQKISRDDAIAEGIFQSAVSRLNGPIWYPTDAAGQGVGFEQPCAAYMALWNSLHTEPGEMWHDNPEVIVTTFSVQHGNIDELDRERRAA